MAFLWEDLVYKNRVSKFMSKKFYEINPRGGLPGTNAPAYSVSPSATKKEGFMRFSTSSSSSSASEVRAPPCPEDGGGDLMTSQYVNFFVADKLERLYYKIFLA